VSSKEVEEGFCHTISKEELHAMILDLWWRDHRCGLINSDDLLFSWFLFLFF
jgi:hypothetical protein